MGKLRGKFCKIHPITKMGGISWRIWKLLSCAHPGDMRTSISNAWLINAFPSLSLVVAVVAYALSVAKNNIGPWRRFKSKTNRACHFPLLLGLQGPAHLLQHSNISMLALNLNKENGTNLEALGNENEEIESENLIAMVVVGNSAETPRDKNRDWPK